MIYQIEVQRVIQLLNIYERVEYTCIFILPNTSTVHKTKYSETPNGITTVIGSTKSFHLQSV